MNSRKEHAKLLRRLADKVERGDNVRCAVYEHTEPVTNPAYGDAVIDAKWWGRSIVLQFGDLDRRVTIESLRELMKK